MSLIYITGISGSGKSTVCKKLKERGLHAHDAEGEGINIWCNNKTGKPTLKWRLRNTHTKEWSNNYSWKTSSKKVEKLVKKAKNKTIFLCGTSENEETIWDLFGKVICLDIDKETLKHRLATRTTNDFGKNPYELKKALEWHKTHKDKSIKKGSIIVDATQPVNTVVEEIIKIVFDR